MYKHFISFIVVCFSVIVMATSNYSVYTVSAADGYKGPLDLTATKNGSTIYIAHFDADEIAVFHTAENKIVQTIPVGNEPTGTVLSPDEKTLYVTSGGYRGLVQAVDLTAGKIIREALAGHTPMGAAITPDGKKIFVCNRFQNDVAEYDLPELKLVRRINVIREPRGAVVTKDGKTVYVANAVPNDVANIPEDPDASIDVAAEVSAIDVGSGTVKNIRLPNGSGSIHGICISPDGRYVYLSEILARFQMPTTQLERGWMNTNGITIIDTTQLDSKRSGFVNTVLLDDVDLGAANPWGITTSADGKQLFIAVAGTSELIIVDTEAMHKKLASLPQDDPNEEATGYTGGRNASEKAGDVPNDLAFLVGMKKRVRLNGKGARPIVAVGNDVYVGMYYSDTLQKVDLTAPGNLKGTEIALGVKPDLTKERRGEIYWNDATLCFQYWQSCASCHPDGRMDAYNWDLLNDGLGNPKNAKSLLWCDKCPPAMWEGVRKTSAHCTRTGFQFILFSMPDETKCLDIDAYIHAMQPVTSPYLVDGKLSERAERGKKIFENPKIGCATCHPAPLFTDQKLHDVNTKCYYDRKGSFDTPTLVETWRTAPYLHDGRYTNMKDLFKKGKHGDVEGDIESLTEEQLDDLIEYVLSL
ncbi:MAG: beta-propeller fold lactonase family protein [Planctomycetaceae bacterium]|jgi:DNA-binding beta-propeller fold protein YncE|nr:beta-propeller fold lactonase family protein [Planctomycetaceae bacterium]